MKKIITYLTTLTLIFLLSTSTIAAQQQTNSNIEFFADGSYLVTTINEEHSSYSTYATIIKTGSKTLTYYNDEGESLWAAIVTGTFSYTGSTSTCTESDISYTIYDTVWRITSASASTSGNTAIGNITAKKYFGGLSLQTVERTVTLTCSPTGVLS